jgi:hypothetical protein
MIPAYEISLISFYDRRIFTSLIHITIFISFFFSANGLNSSLSAHLHGLNRLLTLIHCIRGDLPRLPGIVGKMPYVSNNSISFDLLLYSEKNPFDYRGFKKAKKYFPI